MRLRLGANLLPRVWVSFVTLEPLVHEDHAVCPCLEQHQAIFVH